MTPEDWAEAAEEVAAGIEEAGQLVVLQKPTVTGPANDRSPGPPIETTALAVEDQYQSNEVDGTRIRAADRKFLVSAVGVSAITKDMKLVVRSVTLTVQGVQRIAPGGVTLLYEVQARGEP